MEVAVKSRIKFMNYILELFKSVSEEAEIGFPTVEIAKFAGFFSSTTSEIGRSIISPEPSLF